MLKRENESVECGEGVETIVDGLISPRDTDFILKRKLILVQALAF